MIATRKPLIAFDQSAYSAGTTHAEALRNTLLLAQHCERLGYRRVWVSDSDVRRAVSGSRKRFASCARGCARRLPAPTRSV